MRLEVGGVQYDTFVKARAEVRLDALANSFSFETSTEEGNPLPILAGQAAKVIIGDDTVLTGVIEIVNAQGDDESHTVEVQGRDRTRNLVDSTIGSLGDLVAPITLKTIAEKVIAHIGSDILVVDEVSPAPFTPAEDLGAPEAGENALEFLETFARKRQVLLTSNSEGNLVISRPTNDVRDAWLLHETRGKSNNVLRWAISIDITNRYRTYRSRSQLNPLTFLKSLGIDVSKIVDQGGNFVETDAAIESGRQFVIVSESMYSEGEGSSRATWEANVRRSRSTVYSATVDGHRDQTGDLWRVGKIIRVKDDYAGIDSSMMVNTAVFTLDSGGSSTVLSLVPRDAYQILLAEPAEQEIGIGLGFF